MALATYTFTDSKGDPITMTGIDTGVASAPTQRAFTFQSDEAGGKAQKVPTDYGVATTRSSRSRSAEPNQSALISIDPGLIVSG